MLYVAQLYAEMVNKNDARAKQRRRAVRVRTAFKALLRLYDYCDKAHITARAC